MPRPGRFTPGKKTRYPLCRRLGGRQGRSEGMPKISPLPGFDPRTVQFAIPTELTWIVLCKRYDGRGEKCQ